MRINEEAETCAVSITPRWEEKEEEEEEEEEEIFAC
jgi:hypothetical protein